MSTSIRPQLASASPRAFPVALPAPFVRLFIWLTILAGLLAPACGNDSKQGFLQSGIPGTESSKPNGDPFFVDPNSSGGATRIFISEMFWARLVDIHDVDAAGVLNPTPIFRDFAVDENIQTGVDYTLLTNPITQRTQLIIKRTKGAPSVGGLGTFDDLLREAVRSLPPIAPKGENEGGTFSFIARNATLVIRFSDLLNDSAAAELDLPETVKVFTGYPPLAPFSPRMIFDPNHGAMANGAFHSSRLLIDMTVNEAEASATAQPINPVGLPASLTTLGTSGQPNVSLRIPSRVEFSAGQFKILTNLSGGPMDISQNGPVDNNPTRDVVRAMRSGNAADVNNGFLLDNALPEILGGWPLMIDSATPDGDEFVLGVTFPTVCRRAPQVGNVVQVGQALVEVSVAANPPDSNGQIFDLRVKPLPDQVPPVTAGGLLGSGLFLSPYDASLGLLTGCWVNFVPQAGTFPSFRVPSSAQVLTRFSEPMDPSSLSPFEDYQIIRGDSTTPANPENIVVGDVRPSTNLREFIHTPTLPFSHLANLEEEYHVNLAVATDLAGNPIVSKLPPVDFTIDPVSPTGRNGGVVLRFNETDEIGPDGFNDLRGQFNYDLDRGVIFPRQTVTSSFPADRTNPVPSLMTPVPAGTQTPLSPLGSKLHAVWRYADFGWNVRDESNYNLDVVGINWSPIGGQVIADFYEDFEIRLAHAKQLPDEALNPNGFPLFPSSGLFAAPMFFTDNLLDDPAGLQKTVHPRPLGYEINPVDLFSASTTTLMMPFPLNREGAATQTYTWRDTAVLAKGGNNGAGIPMSIEVQAGVEPGTGTVAGPGAIPSFGLPLLMEFRCYPSNNGIGLNAFDVSVATILSPTPNFRSYSTGGIDTSGGSVVKNPDLQLVPTGAFNPFSTPPGKATNFTADSQFYVGQLDIVIRVSVIHSVWLPVTIFNSVFRSPVMEPGPDEQPSGTQILIDYRGATGFSSDAGDAPHDATLLDPYGDLTTGTVTFLNGVDTWSREIRDIDGARYLQARFTFVNNIETLLNAELSGIGFAFSDL